MKLLKLTTIGFLFDYDWTIPKMAHTLWFILPDSLYRKEKYF